MFQQRTLCSCSLVDAVLVVCSALFLHLVKLYHGFMFVHKISTRVVCVITSWNSKGSVYINDK